MPLSKLDIMVYSIFALLLIWLILKGIGIIESPSTIEMMPYFLAVLAGLGIYHRLDKMDDKIGDMDRRLVRVEIKLEKRKK